jgi:hypothetical protein
MPKKYPFEFALVRGYITRERSLLGKTPKEMARLLGFPEYRVANGAKVYALVYLPTNEQFEFKGYTYWPGGIPTGMTESPVAQWSAKNAAIDKQWMREPEVRAKDNLRKSWTLSGPERLVRIQVNTPDDGRYPIGAGIEQWRLIVPLQARLEWELGPDEPYLPYGQTRYR